MRNTHRTVAITAVATVIVLSGIGPATAADDPGPAPAVGPGGCLLQRVGAHLVRCDDLTGGGVEAPTWIAERG